MWDPRYVTNPGVVVNANRRGALKLELKKSHHYLLYSLEIAMSSLFFPITLRRLTLSNRIVVSPMCQYCAEDGLANAWHVAHLGQLAVSGAGMLMIESTAVEADGRITPGDLGLWNDATEAALRPVLAPIRQYSKIPVVLQLAHAGRKASSHVPWTGGQLIPPSEGGWVTHAPSALPHKEGEAAPLALDKPGLIRVREAFVAAAKRAVSLGFDGLELLGGHGYLLHEFLSPISNQRTDEYGGSPENRMRFPLEVFAAVRAVLPTDIAAAEPGACNYCLPHGTLA
jgi:2,4-dienoyl-CoA reductase-like NADH-dependent reductase (Old Yellow Enzyme family)